jgi:hypothetical protein
LEQFSILERLMLPQWIKPSAHNQHFSRPEQDQEQPGHGEGQIASGQGDEETVESLHVGRAQDRVAQQHRGNRCAPPGLHRIINWYLSARGRATYRGAEADVNREVMDDRKGHHGVPFFAAFEISELEN